ncbi:transcription factor [Candidatus Bathyarchaeota archaeon]|nr:transcription factor [Candidatus Bathyarchaeota archaeon]MCK4702547.1 transcription factor [Candidatus Bathyarchaeota archaeon]
MASIYTVNEETLLNIARVLGGEDGVKIIEVLNERENITVEELAEVTEIQINGVRKLLYRFYNHSLVTNRRFRDKETGWFIFQWSLQPELVEAYVHSTKQKILKKLETRLDYEFTHEFYHCGNPQCPNTTFEDAMETVFHCPYCKEPLHRADNTPVVEFLEKKIAEIKEELET